MKISGFIYISAGLLLLASSFIIDRFLEINDFVAGFIVGVALALEVFGLFKFKNEQKELKKSNNNEQ